VMPMIRGFNHWAGTDVLALAPCACTQPSQWAFCKAQINRAHH
jgi:hypothetical protein